MDAAGALLADGKANPTETALVEELTWLLLRERKFAGHLKYSWPEGNRATFAFILLEIYLKSKWHHIDNVLWSSIVRALSIADLYYYSGGSDAIRLQPSALNCAGQERRVHLHGRKDIMSLTEAAYSFWWIAIKVDIDDEAALGADARRAMSENKLYFPNYYFLKNFVKEESGNDISIDLMKAFEWKICTRVDWNVRMPTMDDFLKLHLQRPWTIYDLDAADNTPTEETLNLLKFWAQYTSGVLMMDPLDMMLQYPPSHCAAAVMVIARVLSDITPHWMPELTTRTLGADDANNIFMCRQQWYVCVHELAALVATSLEECNDKYYCTKLHTTKMDVSLELNRLEQWLEFNSLDVPDVDHVAKKPKRSDDRQKSILTRKRDKYVHNDKNVALIVEETCAFLLSKGYELWRTSKAAT